MHRRIHNGLSMVELLVSITIMSFLSIVVAQSLFTTFRTNTKTELMKELKQNGDYTLDVMTRMIQNAQSVESCTANSMTLVNENSWKTTFYANLDNGLCKIASDSANPSNVVQSTTYLSSDAIGLTFVPANGCATGITFTCPMVNGQRRSATVRFTLQQKGTPQENYERASMPFSTSVVLRNINF